MARCREDENCSSCELRSSCSEEDQRRRQEEFLERRLKHIRYPLMVMSGKGGVGKTTVAVNLAAAWAREGNRVGILDADVHGPNVPKMFGLSWRPLVVGKDGIEPVTTTYGIKLMSLAFLLPEDSSPIVWRGPVKHNALRQLLGQVNWRELDFLIVDLPPGTGDEPLTIAQVLKDKVKGVIIVTTPQEVSLLDARKALSFSKLLGIKVLGVVENMSGLKCPHCEGEILLFKTGGGEGLAKETGTAFLGKIPLDPKVVQRGDEGPPVVLAEPESDVALAFLKVARKIKEALDSDGRGLP